jgi:hypothetical protein
MKKRIPRDHGRPGKDSRKTYVAKTGEHCPLNGWWVPTGQERGRHFIAEGSIMPAHMGSSVFWTLVARDFSSPKPKYAHAAVGAFIDNF